jgi:hypothetical protein
VFSRDPDGDPVELVLARAGELAEAAEQAARVLEPLVLPGAPAGPLDPDEQAAWQARRRVLLDTPAGRAFSRLLAASTALRWARNQLAVARRREAEA